MKFLKRDQTGLGLVLGLLAPIVGFFIFYLLRFLPNGASLASYLQLFSNHQFLIPKVMSLSLLFNAIIFFLYTQNHKDQTARGILIATLVYAIVIIIYKL
ncbi:hypothetical protein [Compostibacter hankyongensis]|uniref:Uncharacterized protein n=1 Tax=Compostibacter hankyongensis TaxID=1007089 RepID=A0ABP8G8I9_9BACT